MLALGRGEQRVRGGCVDTEGADARADRDPGCRGAAPRTRLGRTREQTAARALVAALGCFQPLTVWATCWFPLPML